MTQKEIDGIIIVEDDRRIEVNGPEELPDFANEQEEAEFWRTHTFGDAYWARMKHVPDDRLPPMRSESKPKKIRRADRPT